MFPHKHLSRPPHSIDIEILIAAKRWVNHKKKHRKANWLTQRSSIDQILQLDGRESPTQHRVYRMISVSRLIDIDMNVLQRSHAREMPNRRLRFSEYECPCSCTESVYSISAWRSQPGMVCRFWSWYLRAVSNEVHEHLNLFWNRNRRN